MARIIDITEKLSFEQNPKILIKGTELEVNADAATILQIMGVVSRGEVTPAQLSEMYHLIFPEKSRKEIEKMKLGFSDFQVLVECAINLVTGGEDTTGETQTRTTI